MNSIINETNDSLAHYGMPRRSGRYPWGSGEDPYQHSGDFMSRVQELRKQGLSDAEIAPMVGLKNSTELRVQYRYAKNTRRGLDYATAKSMKSDGYTNQQIADKLGYPNESSVRSLLDEHSKERMDQASKTAEFLKKQVAEKGMIDVGKGTEYNLNISSTKLEEALYMLQLEGYEVYGGRIPQATNPGKQTTQKVLCPPGTEHKEIYDHSKVHSIENYISRDDGQTFEKPFQYPSSMSSKRLAIRYDEDGGTKKDGVIELRRNVADLDLGGSRHSQVRILVDGTHYLKGMAVYSDDMPDGVDVIFNTNKKKGTPMEKVLKPISDDPENPFGSLIKEKGGQSYYFDEKGNKKLSLINKRADEGDWSDWDDKLPSQFLAKQNMSLINKQLNLSIADKYAEYDDICSFTNPTVKRNLLKSFADDCDSTAVHLHAAALPRQKWHVILPVNDLKDNEVYAPNYKDGEKVALVRYPHGGIFEIPICTVNNKNPNARKLIGPDAVDAIGINSKVAERLSGADFDGDTVMVIPTHDSAGKIKIASKPRLKELEDFDPKMEYPYKEGIKTMSKGYIQRSMGEVSNLIMDMTLKGAKDEEMARAVKHSMVVIDAYKHKLDYKQSEIDNNIKALKKKYQGVVEDDGRYHEGAGTLITRAKSQTSVLERKGQPTIDPETGEYRYKQSGRTKTVTRKDGTTYEEARTTKSTKMAETNDAMSLVSKFETPQELAYANYANRLKSLANQARKEYLATGNLKYSAAAKDTYREEVDHLMAQLNVSKKNAPREREAQRIANSKANAIKLENPNIDEKELKKIRQRELTAARNMVGAKRTPITISEREWEAIQAGAITDSKLTEILNFADGKTVRQLATPKTYLTLSPAKINKIKAMSASNHTTAQIAEACGISPATVSKYLKGKE